MKVRSYLIRCVAAIATTSVVVAGCGGGSSTNTSSEADATATTPATTLGAKPDTETTLTPTATATTAAEAMDEQTATDAFPVTIKHEYGSTTIEGKPQRVVSVGYHEQDFLASLGTPPVLGRLWIGDIVNPWSQAAFAGVQPEAFEGEIPFEKIAAMQPDLILGVYSWITAEDYELLSQIAPTVSQSGDFGTGQMPWQDQLQTTGLALGETDQAQQMIDDLSARFTKIRNDHPEWEGLKIGVISDADGGFGAYASGDPRLRFFADLGFDTTALDHLKEDVDDFWLTFSKEQVDLLAELDIVIWYNPQDPGVVAFTETLPFRAAGGDVWLGEDWPTFGFQTNLSIDASLDLLVPELEMAADGDPATVVPSAQAAGLTP